MSEPIEPVETHVVTYDLVDVEGNVKSTHVCFDIDLENLKVPAGLEVRVRTLQSESSMLDVKEVNHVVARQADYPSVGDQLDVIWKVLRAHPELLNSEARQMIARIDRVKIDCPKDATFVTNTGQEGGVFVKKVCS